MLVFNQSSMKDLRTGAKCLEEVIQNQVQAIEDEEQARRQEIANRQAAVTKVRWLEISLRGENPYLFCTSRCGKRFTRTDWLLPQG